MVLFLFKLILPASLIALASLAGRRWGEGISGWLVGLPLTSGPVIAFLALQYGVGFAAIATKGSLIGAAAQAAFCLGYGIAASRGWKVALPVGALCFAFAAFFFHVLPLSHLTSFVLALVMLSVSIRFLPHAELQRISTIAPWWDIPARMIIVTTLVVVLTATAGLAGPKLAGVLATFPVFATILAVFGHRLHGPAAATQVLRGLMFSLFGFSAFFLVLGEMLPAFGVLPAFVAAGFAGLVIQAAALGKVRGVHCSSRRCSAIDLQT